MNGDGPAASVVRRREFFASHLAGTRGLEIGPSFLPTYPKAEGWDVVVLDHQDATALRQTYAEAGRAPSELAAVEEVDHVVPDGSSYVDVVGRQQFDFIVACHVIEHSPDLVSFLTSCHELLRVGGRLLLAVPTRELAFDFYRPLSTLGDVVLAHSCPDMHRVRARIDALRLDASIAGERAWIPETLEVHLRDGRLPETPTCVELDPDTVARTVDALRDESVAADPLGLAGWFGHHWVFEPAQFVWLVEEIRRLFRVPFRVVEIAAGVGSEFLVVLANDVDMTTERTSPGVPLGEGVRDALAARGRVVAPGDPAIYALLPEDLRPANEAVLRQLEHHRKLLAESRAGLEQLRRRRSVRLALRLAELLSLRRG